MNILSLNEHRFGGVRQSCNYYTIKGFLQALTALKIASHESLYCHYFETFLLIYFAFQLPFHFTYIKLYKVLLTIFCFSQNDSKRVKCHRRIREAFVIYVFMR